MFAGEEYFKQNRKAFHDDPLVMKACLDWEKGSITGREAEQQSEGQLKGLCSQSADNPIFTRFVDADDPAKPDEIFYEDEEVLVFPNHAMETRSKSGRSAAMSYVHMMIVPKQIRCSSLVSLRSLASVPFLPLPPPSLSLSPPASTSRRICLVS